MTDDIPHAQLLPVELSAAPAELKNRYRRAIKWHEAGKHVAPKSVSVQHEIALFDVISFLIDALRSVK